MEFVCLSVMCKGTKETWQRIIVIFALFYNSVYFLSPKLVKQWIFQHIRTCPRILAAPGSPLHWQSSLCILDLLLMDPRNPIHFQQATSAPIKTRAFADCWFQLQLLELQI